MKCILKIVQNEKEKRKYVYQKIILPKEKGEKWRKLLKRLISWSNIGFHVKVQ